MVEHLQSQQNCLLSILIAGPWPQRFKNAYYKSLGFRETIKTYDCF